MSNSRGPSRRITLAQVRGALYGLQDADDLPATPSEITEAVEKETTPKTVRKRLKELRENGEVTKHESGPGYVWDLFSEEPDADIDITTQIAGVLQSAELEDIPTQQVRWIAESLPVEDFSDEKKAAIVENVNPELFSDEKIKELLESTNPQLLSELLSEDKVRQVIDSADLDVEDYPDEVAETIVRERYGYIQSFWADTYRAGRNTLAGAGVASVLGFLMLLTSFRIGPYSLPTVAGISLPTILVESEIIGGILFLLGMLLFALGLIYALTGFLGHRYSSVDDPRPWDQFIKGVLRKFMN